MQIDRSKTSVKNIVFGIANKLVTLLMPFVIRTIIIYQISMDYAGLSGLFSSILEMLSLTELGFATAMVFSMYKPIAEDDTEKVCALLRFYRNVYRVIGGVILVLGLSLMPFLPVLISGDLPEDMNLYILYAIYLFNTCVSYFLFGYKSSLLVAHNQNGISSNITTICCLLQYGVQIAVLCIFHNYYAYIVFTPIFTIVANVVRSIVVDKLYPQYKCVGKVDETTLSSIKRNIGGLFFHRIGSVVVNSADNIVISALFVFTGCASSTEATGIYGNYYYIMSAVSGFLVVIYNAISAGVGNAVAVETREKNYNDFKKFTFMNLWMVCWCTVCLFCMYQHAMTIWVNRDGQNPERILSNVTMALFCLYFYTYRARAIATQYKSAAGIFWQDRLCPITEMAVNLILNIVLIRFIGFAGVVLSTVLGMVCVATPWEIGVLFKIYFKRSPWEYVRQQLTYFAATVVLCALTYWICSFLPFGEIWSLFGKLGICIVVPNVLFALLFCRTREMKETVVFVKNFIGRMRRG